MKYFFAALLIVSLFIESSFLSYPLVLGVLLMLAALYRHQAVLWIAFFSGILLDILTFHSVGGSSLFFLGALVLVSLYQRKFEIESPFFVGASVFVFSLLYGALFVHRYSFFSAVGTAILISMIYLGLILFEQRKNT